MVNPEQIEKNIVASFDLVKQDILKLWSALDKLKEHKESLRSHARKKRTKKRVVVSKRKVNKRRARRR